MDLAACSVASSACLRNLIESLSDMLLAGPPFSVYFARPFLDLIGEFIEPTRRFRVSYLGCQTTALDDLALNLNQQFNVFDHNQVLKQAAAIFNWATQGRNGSVKRWMR
jgi:hypothetical protein